MFWRENEPSRQSTRRSGFRRKMLTPGIGSPVLLSRTVPSRMPVVPAESCPAAPDRRAGGEKHGCIQIIQESPRRCNGILYCLRFHLWEKHHIAYGILACKEHGQAVDPDSEAGVGGMPYSSARRKSSSSGWTSSSPGRGCAHLLVEPRALVEGVIQLAEGVADLLPVADRFEPFHQTWLGSMPLRQR